MADFCFPEGVELRALCEFEREDLERGLASAGGLRPGEQAFPLGRAAGAAPEEAVFVLSGGGEDGSDQAYGVCLYSRGAYVGAGGGAAALVRCLCLISHEPLLPLHFEALRQLEWVQRGASQLGGAVSAVEGDVAELKKRAAALIVGAIRMWVLRRRRQRQRRRGRRGTRRRARSATRRREGKAGAGTGRWRR